MLALDGYVRTTIDTIVFTRLWATNDDEIILDAIVFISFRPEMYGQANMVGQIRLRGYSLGILLLC